MMGRIVIDIACDGKNCKQECKYFEWEMHLTGKCKIFSPHELLNQDRNGVLRHKDCMLAQRKCRLLKKEQ